MMKEKHIENCILTWLNYRPDCLAFKVNTGGFFDTKRKVFRKNTSKFIIPGTPDIVCVFKIHNIPVSVFFEVKSESGRQSDSQKLFEKCTQKVGGYYFIVRSIDDTAMGLVTVAEDVSSRLFVKEKEKIKM